MAGIQQTEDVNIISELVAAVNMMKLYPSNHPQIINFVDRLYSKLLQIFKTTSELEVFIIDQDIVFSGKPLSNPGPVGRAFVNLLKARAVDRIVLVSGVTKSQLIQFLSELASVEATGLSSKTHIKIGNIRLDSSNEAQDGALDSVFNIWTFQNRAETELRALYGSIHGNDTINAIQAKKLAADFISTFNQSKHPLKYLSSIKFEDEYTYVHTINVGLLTMSLAEYLGFKGKDLVEVTFAALMHDVGKMTIPDAILNKPGPLNEEERSIMESHPIRGAQYIGQQENMSRLTMLAALEHHIKYDGSGYPFIDTHWTPHIVSQMISVADIYDALRSRRPYRAPLGHEEIVKILRRESGGALNPELVEQFIAMVNLKSAKEDLH